MGNTIIDKQDNKGATLKTRKKTIKKAAVDNVRPKTDKQTMEAINKNARIAHMGKVTYFNDITMIIGFISDGIGYQTKVNRKYKVGDFVTFYVDKGVVVVE